MARYLVVGGAGYIGSHVAAMLVARGDDVVVLDDLSTGFAEAVPAGARLVQADVGDEAHTRALLATGFDGVLHFAARVVVPDSLVDPIGYYANNTVNTLRLVRACVATGVDRVVFSSTAAVYGLPASGVAREGEPLDPINPYGRSKLMSEWILEDAGRAHGLRAVGLRYFNVAGAALDGSNGQRTRGATHLVKVAAEAACGKRAGVTVFGTDLPTPDGSGVRDYIHVDDLARAHLAALDHLAAGGGSVTLNCGYGHGSSVREVLDTMMQVSGATFAVTDGPPRAGDPPSLIADASKIREVLGWEPLHDDLALICRTAWAWERRQGGGDVNGS